MRTTRAQWYIREYLDQNDTLNETPTSREEAGALWDQLQETFKSEAGSGMSKADFLAAVEAIQEKNGFPTW